MANPKDKKELIKQNEVLTVMGTRGDLPIGRLIAIALNRQKSEVQNYKDAMDGLIDKYCVLNDKGERLGVFHEVDTPDGRKKIRKDVSGERFILDDLDIKDGERVVFYDQVKKLNEAPAEFTYNPVNINDREVRVLSPRIIRKGEVEELCNVEISIPMIEALEKKLSPLSLAFVLDTLVEYNKEG